MRHARLIPTCLKTVAYSFHSPSYAIYAMIQETQDKSYPLADLSIFFLKEWEISLAFEYLLYGIYITNWFAAIFLLLLKVPQWSSIQKGLFGITILTFLTTTSCVILKIQFILLQISPTGFSIGPNTKPANISRVFNNIQIAYNFMQRMNSLFANKSGTNFKYVISDGIVVWRAWVAFPHSPIARIILAICMLSGTFIDASLAARRAHHNSLNTGRRTTLLLMALPLLITNIISTVLIAYRTWWFYQGTKQATQRDRNRHYMPANKVQKFLCLLLESGLIYCIFWQLLTIELLFTKAMYPVLMMSIPAIQNSSPGLVSQQDSIEVKTQSVAFRSVVSVVDVEEREE
ncbi:hypothetical protein D9758_016038 [Tetrapyrgos nigripes]|uniref:Uncharacterized protein n=1 Tax=Tetrapyrgos nigripes TaxID=182062 RepID=A0A8H5FHT9_9AGAR|nr:hypothetical protein D9758_016038 [Tetrapyrgos nigripes]